MTELQKELYKAYTFGYTVAQIMEIEEVSESVVKEAIRLGELKAKEEAKND